MMQIDSVAFVGAALLWPPFWGARSGAPLQNL